MPSSVEALVLSKSLALVEKTKRRIAQIDTSVFPTPSTEVARRLLSATLEKLGDKAFWQAMNAEALYHALIQMQALVERVEASTCDHISWPLVSYCDHFWRLLFPREDVQMFYSVFAEHNYGIESFSHRLRLLLESVLPPAQIDDILRGVQIYCLQIASLEDENLPLYANIGHEFGHALYRAKEQEILPILAATCDPVFGNIGTDLRAQHASPGGRRASRCAWILVSIATELFSDLVGSMIAGPAFLLSLHEMGWGTDLNSWSTKLSPQASSIRAYPSFAFRLSCVRRHLRLAEFQQELQKHLRLLPGDEPRLERIAAHLTDVPEGHSSDHVTVRPVGDGDASAIQQALERHMTELKRALEAFIHRCSLEQIAPFCAKPEFAPVSGQEVSELIRRLDADILPNIIPNKTLLLGVPASFATILNASALFRRHVLSRADRSDGPEEIDRKVQKLGRLTAKALEVSYIQGDFNAWEAQRSP